MKDFNNLQAQMNVKVNGLGPNINEDCLEK